MAQDNEINLIWRQGCRNHFLLKPSGHYCTKSFFSEKRNQGGIRSPGCKWVDHFWILVKGEMYSVVESFLVRNWESTAIGDYPIYYDIKFRCVKNTNENVVQKTRISTKYRSVEPSHQAGPGSHFNHLRNASDIATLEVISTRANWRPASRQYLSTS